MRDVEAAHRADLRGCPCSPIAAALRPAKRSSSHGVTVTATKNENSIAIEALAGIGLMYGPIMPLTNIIGSSAATMVSVATMVGLPTSATASTAASAGLRLPSIPQCRAMFSTITIASSTRMPIEKMSANRLTRLIV